MNKRKDAHNPESETTVEVKYNGKSTGPIEVSEFQRRVDRALADPDKSTEMVRLNPQIGKVALVSVPLVYKGVLIGTGYALKVEMEISATEKEPLSRAQDILTALRLAPPEMRTYVAFGQEQVPLDLESAPMPGQTTLEEGADEE